MVEESGGGDVRYPVAGGRPEEEDAVELEVVEYVDTYGIVGGERRERRSSNGGAFIGEEV